MTPVTQKLKLVAAAALLCLIALMSTTASAQQGDDLAWDRQIAYIQGLIAKEPSVPLHSMRMAQAYAKMGREGEMMRHVSDALEKGGNKLAADILIGDFLANQGRYDEALRYYTRVLDESPFQGHVLTRVWKLVQRSRSDQVGLPGNITDLSRRLNNAGFYVSDRPPANNSAAAVARLNEANRLLNESDVRGAVASYKEAALQDPWNPDIYRGLGIAYARSKDRTRALGAYQLYIALAPPDRADVPKVRQIIVDFYVQGE